MIYIGNVKILPASSLEDPWRFKSLDDAQIASRILDRSIYAAVIGENSVWRIYPGGRTEHYSEKAVMALSRRKQCRRGEAGA